MLDDTSGSGLIKEWYQYQGAECLLISNRDALWLKKKKESKSLFHSLQFVTVPAICGLCFPSNLLEEFLLLISLQHFLWIPLSVKVRVALGLKDPDENKNTFACCEGVLAMA